MKISIQRRVGAVIAVFSAALAVSSPALVSAVSNTANTTISAAVSAVISISTGGTVSIALTPTGAGVLTSNNDTVTVSTNNALGYNLTLADNDTNTNLVNGGNNFAASAGTMAVPITLANNTWGVAINTGTTGAAANAFDASYAVETNNASSTSKWAGIPASSGTALLLKSTSGTATNDTTAVWYAVKATTALPAGTYSDTVTYTATTN